MNNSGRIRLSKCLYIIRVCFLSLIFLIFSLSLCRGKLLQWSISGNCGTEISGAGIFKSTSHNFALGKDDAFVTFTTDYFRSKTSGNWGVPSSWESSLDNLIWVTASSIPTSSSRGITIRNSHTITLNAAASATLLTIDPGGTLTNTSSGGGYLLTIVGDSSDVDFKIVGTYELFGIQPSLANSATVEIYSGGVVKVRANTNGESDNFARDASVYFLTGSIFDWNTTDLFETISVTYFPTASAGAIPIFRVSAAIASPGASTYTVINGLLEVNSSFSLSGSGPKTFRDGIQGSSTLTQTGSGGFNITGTTAVLGGNLILNIATAMDITNGITIPSGANVKVSGAKLNKTNGIFQVDGTIDVSTIQITNTSGSVIINGIFKTANTSGFSGTGASIPAPGTITLNSGSTIEFYAPADQTFFSRPDFKNLTFSGSGTKTPSSGFNSVGTIYITGSAILDVKNYTVGNSSTNLTMDGGRLRIDGNSSGKPDIDGTFSLTGGIIEFYHSGIAGNQTIKGKNAVPADILYNQIEVTGNKVGNSNSNITLRANGSFTVKNGGSFEINDNSITNASGTSGQSVVVENNASFLCGNNQGFNGYTSSLTNNSSVHANITNITLNTGSTVNYQRSGDQPVTNANSLIYHHLILSGSGNKTAPSGILTVQGNLSKSGSPLFVHNSGTVLLNGTTQYFAGFTYNNLQLSNSGTKTTSGNSSIADSLKINTGVTLSVTAADSITFLSTASKTGRLGIVDGSISYNTTGKFVVERYIPAGRKWRFLSVPTNSTQTFRNSWQENNAALGNTLPGYGMHITDSVSATFFANGFDAYSPGGPSVKVWTHTANAWLGISNTTSLQIKTTGGYMCFVRGNRGTVPATSTTSTTILRTTGQLYTGTQTEITITNAGEYKTVGNPFASEIDLRKVFKSNPYDEIYIWDPTLYGSYGVGGYRTLTLNVSRTDYYIAPSGGIYGSTSNFIQSGQAFFIRGEANGETIQFSETDKSTGSDMVFFTWGIEKKLRVNLLINNSGNPVLVDGVLVYFDNSFSNAVDYGDATKISNSNENVGLLKEGWLLSIERRRVPGNKDTLHVYSGSLRVQNYRWEIIAENMDAPGRTGFLLDNYLNTTTPLNLAGINLIDFTVDNKPESAAANRFKIVFSKGHIHTKFTDIAATKVSAYIPTR